MISHLREQQTHRPMRARYCPIGASRLALALPSYSPTWRALHETSTNLGQMSHTGTTTSEKALFVHENTVIGDVI